MSKNLLSSFEHKTRKCHELTGTTKSGYILNDRKKLNHFVWKLKKGNYIEIEIIL